MTNLEKWNKALSKLNSKTNDFITKCKEGKQFPTVYYIVHPIGKLAERTIVGVEYSHYKHGGKTYFSGKRPTKLEVKALEEYTNSNIPFDIDNVWFKYTEVWDVENNRTSSSSVKFLDIVNQHKLFFSKEDAETEAERVTKKNEEEKAFKELHKKDASYNYSANGYKFLGWQNGWKHHYYDEDGNLCEESGKSSKTFGYKKEDYPEYSKCMEAGHQRIEVSHRRSGSENTVSCPKCKVYWKYDCSG